MTFDDVLSEFVTEADWPTAENLEKWVEQYPQYRRELVDFATAWAEQLMLLPAPELGAEVEAALVDRTISHMLNVAHGRDEQVQGPGESDDPIESLIGEAKRAGMSGPGLAMACGLDLALISKLNNRQIQPQTIPASLINQIGQLFRKPTTVIAAYFNLSPQAVANQAFLARRRPANVGQQSFADAVRASSLSTEQKVRWLDDAAGRE